jgi:hypothetical protein
MNTEYGWVKYTTEVVATVREPRGSTPTYEAKLTDHPNIKCRAMIPTALSRIASGSSRKRSILPLEGRAECSTPKRGAVMRRTKLCGDVVVMMRCNPRRDAQLQSSAAHANAPLEC